MTKKKSGKIIQMLSPENYIRQKARSLPIYECLVNEGWQEAGFANLVIARSHINGNITACIYLVDLYCLGIKETYYQFNIPGIDYQEKIAGNENFSFIPISYTLAHNIVYAGIEFADEFGFKPHKDFTSITRFMLDEDTDEVELVEIECGKDGKPLYVSGPYDDEQIKKRILAQLEKTAGSGNYDFILEEEEPEDDYLDEDELDDEDLDEDELDDEDWDEDELDDEDLDDDESDEDEEDDEFKGMTLEEKKKMFLDYKSRSNKLKDEELIRFVKLSDNIYKKFTDTDLVDEYFDEFYKDFDIELTNDKVPDEMLGLLPGSTQVSESTRLLFLKIFELAFENPLKADKLLKDFRKQTQDIPAPYFLELHILQQKKSKTYAKKLEEYVHKYPDYPLIKLLWIDQKASSETEPEEYNIQKFGLQSFFPDRTVLHSFEMFNFLLFTLIMITEQVEASRLEAFYQLYHELDIPDHYILTLDNFITFIKVNFVNEIFNQ